MKIDRLIGIITLLLQKEKITAPELAERFEVSRRTINRDIEHLCMAGIPVVTSQGFGGGIRVQPGYTLDRSMLTRDEFQAILAGLMGLDSVSRRSYRRQLSEKLFGCESTAEGSVLIDLASHYAKPLTEKTELLRQAIAEQHIVAFRYADSRGDESARKIEPYRIVYKWSSWYIFGYCPDRSDFRLFKLNRLWDLRDTEVAFSPRAIPSEKLDFDRFFSVAQIRLLALFHPGEKHRLIEEYGVDCCTVQGDGRLLLERDFADYANMREWVLSFGDRVVVLAPESLKNEIVRAAKNILAQYEQT